MLEFFLQYGLWGLFVVSFLASTLLPVASEAIIIGMVAFGFNIWHIMLFATSGNYLGSLVNYFVGLKGRDFFLSRVFSVEERKMQKAENLFQRWGAPILLLSWAPVIGDPLTAFAGVLRLPLMSFSIWVLVGKVIRYLVFLGVAKYIIDAI